MMVIFKKSFMLIVIVALVLLVFSFNTAAKTVVEFWPWWLGTFEDYLNDIIADFETQNPDIKIEMHNVDGDMPKVLLPAIVAGECPDVVNLNTRTAPSFFKQGVLAKLELYTEANIRDEFIDAFWKNGIYDGEFGYAFPWYTSPQILIYNKEIFEKAGLDPEISPKTWEEVLEFSRKIRQKTGKYGFAASIRPWEIIGGVDEKVFTDDLKTVAFNTQKVANRLNFFRTAYKESLMPENLPDYQEARTMFEAGEVAMYPVGVSMVKHIEINSPELAKNLGFGKFPTSKDGTGVIKIHAGTMNLVVLKCSDNKEAAVKWARFLTSSEAQTKFAKIATVVPSTRIGLEKDPFFTENNSLGVQAQLLASKSMSEAEDLNVVFFPNGWVEIKKLLKEGFETVIKGKRGTQETLNSLEERVNEIIVDMN